MVELSVKGSDLHVEVLGWSRLLGLKRSHLRLRQLGLGDGARREAGFVELARVVRGLRHLAGEIVLRLLQRAVEHCLLELQRESPQRQLSVPTVRSWCAPFSPKLRRAMGRSPARHLKSSPWLFLRA